MQAVVLVRQLHVLARDGAHVICLDVPQQQADLDRVAADIGGSTLAIDITAADAGEKLKRCGKTRRFRYYRS